MSDFSMDCENEIEIDVQLTCRCCLLISTEADDFKNLFSTVLIDGKLLALPLLIFKIFGITVAKNDGFPTRICVQCLDRVKKNYTFRKKFERTNKTLHQILKIPLKAICNSQKVVTNNVDCQTESPVTKSTLVQTIFTDWKHATTQCDSLLTKNNQSQTEGPTIESVYVNTDIDALIFEDLESSLKPSENADIEEYCEEEYLVEEAEELEVEDFKPTIESFLGPATKLEPESKTKTPKSRNFCQICRKEVDTLESVEQHKAIHTNTYRRLLASTPMFNCGICRSIFLTLSVLNQHITNECRPIDYANLVAESSQLFDVCLDNSAGFVSVKQQNGVYSCDQCHSFWSIHLEHIVMHCTKDHLPTADYSLIGPHTCSICFRVFSTAVATRIHILAHLTYFSCTECDFKCENLDDFLEHEVNEHFETTNRKCRHCDEPIAAGVTDEQHDLQCTERRYQCGHCEKKFLKRGTLRIHERIHEGKRLECDICGRRFVQSGDLKSHQRIHNGHRPYKCEICGKKFRISSHRADHMSTHSAVNEFQCAVCDKMFKSKRILAEHGRIHNVDNRKHKCNICFKTFLRNTHLQSHYRVHQPKGTEK